MFIAAQVNNVGERPAIESSIANKHSPAGKPENSAETAAFCGDARNISNGDINN
jgi:hypothetical protein